MSRLSDGDAIHRAASALRTALAAKPMVRFDAPRLVGPAPRAGRMVERVEASGRHIELVWDDNMVLQTNLRMNGTWHVYRRGEPWRRPFQQMCVAIEVADWVAVCFNAQTVETYRIPDRRRHPGMGRLGPDLCQPNADLSTAVNLLLSYDDGAARLGEVLLDQRVLRGLGNVYRCEVLWETEFSPFARVDSLNENDATRLVNTAASMLRANMQQADRAAATAAKGGFRSTGVTGSVVDDVARPSTVASSVNSNASCTGVRAVSRTLTRINRIGAGRSRLIRTPQPRRISLDCRGTVTTGDLAIRDQ